MKKLILILILLSIPIFSQNKLLYTNAGKALIKDSLDVVRAEFKAVDDSLGNLISLIDAEVDAIPIVSIDYPDANTIQIASGQAIHLDPATLVINGSNQLTVVGGVGGADSSIFSTKYNTEKTTKDSLYDRMGAVLDIDDLAVVKDYEPVIADSSILLYKDGVWQIWDLGSALQSLVVGTPTLPDSIVYTSEISGKASTTLNNLGTTSINANLIPDTDNLRYLGSASEAWTLAYINALTLTRNGYGVTVGLTGVLTQQSNLYFPRNVNGTMALGTGTANQLAYWVGTNTLGSLTTSTYPTLTELAYIKGVTSNIQTQLDSKLAYTDTSVVNDLIQEWSDTASVTSNYSLGHIDTTVAKVDSITISIATFNSLIATLQTLVTQLSGGTTGQALVKASDNDYDFVWATIGTPDLSDNTPPLAPTSYVAIGGTSETQYVSTWTDPVDADLSKIYWYEGSANDSTTLALVDSINAGVQTYTRTGRTANTTYWSAIKAVDDSGNVSYFSNIDSATTLASAVIDTGFYMLDAEDGVGMLTITGGGITASTDIAYAGTYSYKVAGLGGTTRTYADFDFPAGSQNQDTIWVTYRIYIPTGTAVADGGWNYASLLIGGVDANGDNGEFGLNSSTNIDGWQKPFGTLVSTNFSTNAWHKIEIMYIQGTGANAKDYVYVDEDLIYSTNTGAGTVDTDGFRFGAYNWTMASGEAIYFDNIIFSTSRLPLD